jgi:hypothetical protein
MKFLVLWHFDLTRLGREVTNAVMQMPDYAKKLGDKWPPTGRSIQIFR